MSMPKTSFPVEETHHDLNPGSLRPSASGGRTSEHIQGRLMNIQVSPVRAAAAGRSPYAGVEDAEHVE